MATSRFSQALALIAVAGASISLAPTASAAPDSDWDRLAHCESTSNWSINTGNGFYGGLQFTPSTWRGFGGGQFAPSAHLATREQQIFVAEKVLAVQGWGAWPACSRKLGLRSAPTDRPYPGAVVTANKPAPKPEPAKPAPAPKPADEAEKLLRALEGIGVPIHPEIRNFTQANSQILNDLLTPVVGSSQ